MTILPTEAKYYFYGIVRVFRNMSKLDGFSVTNLFNNFNGILIQSLFMFKGMQQCFSTNT